MASNSSENLNFEKENLLTNLSPVLQELRSSGKLCDVDIKVGSKIISAHRVILATVIPYFHRTICSANPENGGKMEIIMKEMNAEVIESLINYCYTGKIEIDRKNVENLFFCAKLFELYEIRDACVKFMTTDIQMDNVIKLKNFGQSNKIDQLITAADKFICENFEQVSASQEFVTLSSSQLIEIIGWKNLKVSSQKEFYEAAIKWVTHNQNQRIFALPEILRKVKLASLPTEYLIDVVSKENLIRQSIECRDILDEAKNELISMSKDFISQFRNLNSIQHTNEVIYIVGRPDLFLKYENNEWKSVTKLFKSKLYFGVALMNKKIYVIGGSGSSSVEIFDIQTNEWSQGASLNEKRYDTDAAVLNGRMYVCGGSTGSTLLNSVECFTESQNKWEKVASLNQSRYSHNLVSLNGFLYAIGGHSYSGAFNSCERYCPKKNRWTFVAPMKTSRYGLGAATLNGKIYACGAYNSYEHYLNLCEVYDPDTDSWSSIAPMNEKRYKYSLASCNGKLYAIGGYNGRNYLSSVEEYCPEKNEWKFVTPLPEAASVLKAVTLSP